jgi:hypothetical protein
MSQVYHRVTLRLALVLGILLVFGWFKGSQDSILTTRTNFFNAINATLEDAINHALIAIPENHPVKPVGYGSVSQFQSFQDEPLCLLEAGNSVKGTHSRNSCSSLTKHHALATHVSSICNNLGSKRLLLLGPSLTFTLHNHLLSHVSRISPNSPPHTCLGPEFCTFHHICVSSSQSSQPEGLVVSKTLDRHLKPPSPRDLLLTHSSLVHYIQSSSLYSGSNKEDLAYTAPTVDSWNGVRIKEAYWLGPARRADLIVLNRGPIPAPAWTYDGSVLGNWTFADRLPYLPSVAQLRLARKHREDLRIFSVINAAITATLAKFVPEVLQTLYVLRSDDGIRMKPIIWHGSSYRFRVDLCEHSRNVEEGISAEEYFTRILERTNEKHVAVDRREENLWGLYHDTQGTYVFLSSQGRPCNMDTVYMQERILQAILPQWNIIFLPLDVGITSLAKADNASGGPQERRGQKCTRCCREEDRAIGSTFLGGLGYALHKISRP